MNNRITLGFVALIGFLLPLAVMAQDPVASPPPSGYISRAEYDKLKAEHEAMKLEMESLKTTVRQMAAGMAPAAPEGPPLMPTVKKGDEAKADQAATPESVAPSKQVSEAKETAAPPTVAEVAPELSGPLATHNFTMVGDAEVQFGKVSHQHGAFLFADFAPIFLFRGGDKILFEAGFDFNLQNNAPGSSGYTTTLNLSFATIDYLLNDYITVVAGDMLLPLGTYSERSAGWLNKFPDAPLPRAVLPGNGIGVQFRGGIPLGEKGASLTYSGFVVNGPGSVDGTGNAGQLDLAGNVGLTSDGRATNNLHGGIGEGGRVAIFWPWKSQYDLEVGVSGMSSAYDNASRQRYTAGVLDASLHLGPSVEVKGEYMNTWVGTNDLGTIHPRGWWVQGGYKLSGLKLGLPVLDKLELVGRYDTVNDALGTRTRRGTIGGIYYVTNTLWLEGDYEFTSNRGPNPAPDDSLLFQISYGF